jgi:hypothetical protein
MNLLDIEPIITKEMLNENFWPGFITGIMMIVKQPMFIILVVMIILLNILKAKTKKKRK